MNDDGPREAIDDDECRTHAEREFVAAVSARALSWAPIGVTPSDIVSFPYGVTWVLIIDVTAPSVRHILRTLRVEFGPEGVAVGDDLTQQGHPLDPLLQPVTKCTDDSPVRLAAWCADWIEHELQRPIEEHEWSRYGFTHRRWIYADTGELLSWSDSANYRRGPYLGSPDSIRLVRGFRSAPSPTALRTYRS